MIKTRVLDIMVILAWLWMIINSYVVTTSPCAEEVLTGTAMMLGYFIIRQLPIAENSLLIVLSVWVAHEIILGVLQTLGIVSSNHLLYSLTGTFGNPGPYGGFLAVMTSIFAAKYMRTKSKYWGIVALACLCVLPVTWSRSAWLAVVLAIGCMLLKRHKKIVLCGMIALAIVAIPIYFMKSGSANGRLVMALISCVAIGQNPWFGSGVGSFLSSYGKATDKLMSVESSIATFGEWMDVPGNAFCEILKIGVEQGLIGMLLWLVIAVYGGLILYRRHSPLLYGWISLVVFSCFSYPFDLWEFRILMVLLVCGVNDNTEKKYRFMMTNSKKSLVKYVVCLLLLIFAETIVVGGLMKRNEARATYRQMTGMTDVAFLKDYERLLPLMNDDSHFLFDYSKTLQNAMRWNESNYILREGEKVSADPMFIILRGNNYQSMGLYSLADSMYMRAWRRVPNRIYPIYKNMMMYRDIGNEKLSSRYAEMLLSTVPKIESPATREMQQTAKNIIKVHK